MADSKENYQIDLESERVNPIPVPFTLHKIIIIQGLKERNPFLSVLLLFFICEDEIQAPAYLNLNL